jgi:hypothetical protein
MHVVILYDVTSTGPVFRQLVFLGHSPQIAAIQSRYISGKQAVEMN